MSHSPHTANIKPSSIVWAVFLATSWTWCIGLFFPVLLVRDFGILGFVAFAVPNVLGAASVGYLRYTTADGVDLVKKHHVAMVVFSLVTIAFHIFFAGWFIPRLLGPWTPLLFFMIVIYISHRGWTNPLFDLRSAATVLIVSAIMFNVVMAYSPQNSNPLPSFQISHSQFINLLYCVPALSLGFLTCPHLDLTFHRARREMSPRDSRVAFTIAFGFFFLLLILFSLYYATSLNVTLEAGVDNFLPPPILKAIGVHMLVQSALTVSLHVREIREVKFLSHWRVFLSLLVGATLLLQLGNLGEPMIPRMSFPGGELVYRCFLGFYGLVFPAYVIGAMLWSRTPSTPADKPSRASLLVTGFVVAVCLPLFAAGFIFRQPLWLVPGVGIVLAVPLLWRFWPRSA